MAGVTWIKSKHVSDDTDRKYDILVGEFFAGLQSDFSRMMKNPNFQRFFKDISDDIDRDDPDAVFLTQRIGQDYGSSAADDPIVNYYIGPLSVHGRIPSNYGLPAYFDTVQGFLGLAYSLAQHFNCQTISIVESAHLYLAGSQEHLFATSNDFKNYLNNTFGYRKNITCSSFAPHLNEGSYCFVETGFLTDVADILFSGRFYGTIERNHPSYLPCMITLYRRYIAPPERKEEKLSWY